MSTSAPSLSDEALSLNTFRGDRDAFARLYERYYQGVYDFSLRMVGDADVAADIVQGTFVNAWSSLCRRRISGNIKAWIYAIARNKAIDELRVRKRVVSGGDTYSEESWGSQTADPGADEASDPEAAVRDKELVELVWQSAGALSAREYSLLDLHLRRGLSADELAASLNLRKSNVYNMLSRLRGSLEESVSTVLLIRHGRRDCPELNAILSELTALGLRPEVRRAVQKHLQACPRCQESKRRYVSPSVIFSGMAVVSMPAGHRRAVWDAISSRIGGTIPTPPASPIARLAGLRAAAAPVKLRIIAGAGAAAAAAVAGALLLAPTISGPSNPAGDAEPRGGTAVAGVQENPSGAPPAACTVSSAGDGVGIEELVLKRIADAGSEAQLSASAGLCNYASASAAADVSLALAGPSDCSSIPESPVIVTGRSLPTGVPVSINRVWRISCSAAGPHAFSVTVDLAAGAVADANPDDNRASESITIDVRN